MTAVIKQFPKQKKIRKADEVLYALTLNLCDTAKILFDNGDGEAARCLLFAAEWTHKAAALMKKG